MGKEAVGTEDSGFQVPLVPNQFLVQVGGHHFVQLVPLRV